MADRTIPLAFPGEPLEINIAGQSPHVVSYRLWHRAAGTSTWTIIADGDTADDVADLHTVGPFAAGDHVAYWLGLGGNPQTAYRALVSFGQRGRILAGGACIETGRTNNKGVAEAQLDVVLA